MADGSVAIPLAKLVKIHLHPTFAPEIIHLAHAPFVLSRVRDVEIISIILEIQWF
jgi:hypothetical protein